MSLRPPTQGTPSTATFESRIAILEEAPLNVQSFGLLGDGSDESTTMQAIVTQALSRAKEADFYFPNPDTEYKFGGIVLGLDDAPRAVRLIGENGRATKLRPVAGQTMFAVRTWDFPGGDYFEAKNLLIQSTDNFAYDVPVFVDLKLVRNFLLEHVDAVCTGTGTFMRFDGAYQGAMRTLDLRCGRYMVPFEITADTTLPDPIGGYTTAPVSDTILLDGVVTKATLPAIVRNNADTGVSVFYRSNHHTLQFRGFKQRIDDSDLNVAVQETIVAGGGTAAGASLLTVAGGGVTAASLIANQPIIIGYGQTVDVNKILSISTDTLTLAKPLRYAHAAGEPVLGRGACLAVSSNVGLVWGQSCHFEGHPIGVLTDGPTEVMLDQTHSSVGELIRAYGTIGNLIVGATQMIGTPTALTVLKLPNNGVTPGFLRLLGPFPKMAASPFAGVVTAFDDPGNRINGAPYESYSGHSSAPGVFRNAVAGQASSTVDNRRVGGAQLVNETWDGTRTVRGAVQKVGTGSPEGVVTSGPGGIFQRTDGGVGTTLYVKQTGTGNTGWAAIA